MEIYRVAFIGHREINNANVIEQKLEDEIRLLLSQKEYVEFYIGRNGDFDILAASVIKRVQNALGHANSSIILVQPYHMKDDEYYKEYYDEIYYPLEGKMYPKSAITKRNRWMVENAELLVAYVENGRAGGALTTLNYAQKQGIKILNIALYQ